MAANAVDDTSRDRLEKDRAATPVEALMSDNLVEPILTAKVAPDDDAHERQLRGNRQLLLARSCLFASTYVASVILARQLGATDYGIYGVVISQLAWLEMLMNAGVTGASAKLIADGRHDPGQVERSARALLVGFAILLLGVCWLLVPRVASLMRISNGATLFRIAIIDLPLAALYASYEGVFYGHRRFGVLATAQVVYGLTKLTGVVALMALGFSVERVLVVNVASTAVVGALLTVRYRPRGLRPRRAIVAEIASVGPPMAIYLVASQVLVNLDLWSLKALWEGSGAVIGHYVVSLNVAGILKLIPAVQAGVLFASVAWAVASRDAARAGRHIREATRFALIIALPACVVLGLDASEILSVLFTSAYAEGQRFLPLQLAGFGLFALLDAFSVSLMAAGRPWLAARVVVALVPLVWLSNYLLIPLFGPLGAATSMLLGMALGAALTGSLACRQFGSLIGASMLWRVLVAAAAVGLTSAAIPVRGPLVIVKLGLLGALYLLALWALGEITGRDFGFAKRSSTNRSA